METEAKLTRLASCAGCGAKVGAGTLSKLLQDFKTHTDPRLIVGFDKSDDACVYKINEETALIQTVDFFPPIVDDPYLFGQIAAANAISDIYAMGGEPRLALNLLCAAEQMKEEWIREILRGGYDKAYEAGVIISGGHTIRGSDPLYGLSVTGFGDPAHILQNSGAEAGDILILTKPLGIGILTTAAKAELPSEATVKAVSALAGAAAAAPILAVLRGELALVAEVDEGRHAVVHDADDVAALAAVPAVGAAGSYIFLTVERNGAVAAVPGLDADGRLIDEHSSAPFSSDAADLPEITLKKIPGHPIWNTRDRCFVIAYSA